MSDFIIGHVTDPKEGPLDGVYAETKGTNTKNKGTGAFLNAKRILHHKVADVRIKARFQTGNVRMKSGKNMPVDMALHNYKKDSTGKEKIVTPDGEVLTGRILVGERGDGAGYISHFASCKKYRR